MKVQVLQENLVKGVIAVSRITSSGGKLPILSHILLRAQKEGLFLSATNLEMSVTLKIGARIEKVGAIAVPARLLGEFVSSLVAGKIEMEAVEEQLQVTVEGTKAKFQGILATEFPEIPTELGEKIFEFKQNFEDDVTSVAFAAATDDSRPVITGVQWKKEDGKLRMAATDGYRLSVRQTKVEFIRNKQKKEAKDFIKIIPAKTLLEVAFLMKSFKFEGGVEVGITKNENQIVFKTGDVVLASRLLEGEFPPFEHIIPDKQQIQAVINQEDFLGAIRTAAIFARESANIVKVGIKKGKIEVSANNPQVGGEESVVEAETKGEEGKIAFNSRYLLDFLGSVKTKIEKNKGGAKIILTMNGPLAPGLFKILGEEDYLHVIMPVRVQE